MTIKRLGFPCKYIDRPDQVNGVSAKDDAKKYNTGTTTVSWLDRQSRAVAEERLWDLMKANIEAIRMLVTKVGTMDPSLRMVRLSSDILPVYTHAKYAAFWQQADVQAYMARAFARVGEIARAAEVRLSFHPGQFCCLVSENPGIVQNSIDEFEYHVDMARHMGYGRSLLDFKINVHLSGKRGVDGFAEVYDRLSPEARNTITLENDEYQAGLDVVLKLKDKVGIVLDLHHNWINTGEYISASDDRIAMIKESWCRDGTDRRPVIHYSQSREDILVGHDPLVRPEMAVLIGSGFKKAKMRAHSDFMWNRAVNEWAYDHWTKADVMLESKGKNLSVAQLAEYWSSIGG